MKKWIILTALLWTSVAQAANCGGGIVCHCGDTVTSNYSMPGDLSCGTGHGLRISNSVTLDCANHNIYGGGGQPDTYGLYLDGSYFSEIKNCGVFYFDRGIRFNNSAQYNFVHDTVTGVNGNFSTHVGYGVDFAGSAMANFLLRVIVLGNADEGIHIGTNANLNHVNASVSCGNFRESLYVLGAAWNNIFGNDIGADCYGYTAGSTSMYMKDGAANYFEWNHFHKGAAHVTGNSYKSMFLFNTYDGGSSYQEDCYVPTGQCPSFTITVN
jgi:hypothetical protein